MEAPAAAVAAPAAAVPAALPHTNAEGEAELSVAEVEAILGEEADADATTAFAAAAPAEVPM